jgi:hypothetical protein
MGIVNPTLDYHPFRTPPLLRYPWNVLNTRAAVLLAAIVLFIGVVLFYTNAASSVVFLVLIVDGLTALAWTAGAAALGAVILRRCKMQANPLLMIASAAGLGLGILSLIGLGLGLLGKLNRGVALAMPIAGAALFCVDLLWCGSANPLTPGAEVIRRPGSDGENPGLRRTSDTGVGRSPLQVEIDLGGVKRWLLAPAGISWLWLVPVISLATAAVAASLVPGILWKPLDPHPYDVISYHLQVPREWYEAGKIIPLEHNVFSYFPFNVEMQFLLLMHATGGPWNAMFACQLLTVTQAMLMILAIAGASDDRNGVIGAAMASVVPWVVMLASVAYVESALMLYTALCAIWALRAMTDDSRASREPSGSAAGHCPNACRLLVLSGAFAGFACGAKITAVPMLLLAVPIALAVTFPWKKAKDVLFTPRKFIGDIAIFLIVGSIVLSPWLLRNIAWAGNPLFPVAMKTLGKDHFTDAQVERFRVAHSPTASQQSPTARLNIVWKDVLTHWQYGYLLLPVAAVAAAWRWRDRQTWMLLVTMLIIFIVWIGFTHLLSRFLVMLIPLAGILIARARWGRILPVGIAITLLAAGLGWAGVYGPLAYWTRDPDRVQLIGRQDLAFMTPDALSDMTNTNKQVGLVGDAGAFLYQIPMSRLHYRTVFDLPGDVDNPIDAWLGPQAKSDPNWLLVINPTEIARLHRTYRNTPALPREWEDRDQPFVLGGGHVNEMPSRGPELSN